ncbi:hypothetical protein [Spongiimicrobium sp. 3-5]|uniref:hypothetical protein n=1 Tax=Spongiimicrobium sp. 3-5 TaxID=3332596 RepID=UPI003980B57A
MKKNDDFYIGYSNKVAQKTKKLLKRFVLAMLVLLLVMAAIFGLTQNKDKNSVFEFGELTKITGVYHELPYPMLKVKIGDTTYKNILLVGFGKFSANPTLQKIRAKKKKLSGSILSISGNLIYYNGKTLLQITDEEKITLVDNAIANRLPKPKVVVKNMELRGEIIDPKCYFGVMKPGKGKIHRSCASLCISGGIPPVLATTDDNNIAEYYLITDIDGNPIHQDILPYIGKPSLVRGNIVQMEDWYQLQIDTKDIVDLNQPSNVY